MKPIDIVPKYINDMVKAHGLDASIEKTKKHLEVAVKIDAHKGAIEFLTTVRDDLNKMKENV